MQAPPAPAEVIVIDDAVDDLQQTQTEQATQPLSQDADLPAPEAHLWGFLVPCNPAVGRIEFFRKTPTVQIGRNANQAYGNHVVLPGLKISNRHCEIKWDGNDSRTAIITVSDLSSNGTFINNEKIGKGRHSILKEGAEIAFGTSAPQQGSHAHEDYRYVFRLLAGGPPPAGLHHDYSIAHELGKGAFATVFKAMHKASGVFYAVKMIQSNRLRAALTHGGSLSLENGSNLRPTEQFGREIDIMKKLQHESICMLKEVFFEPANISLVLEYVPGGDLLDYIANHDGVPEPEAGYITSQICDAMAYVHEKGVAHRDIKPENILLTTDKPPRVKIADFGLAKAVNSYTMLRTMCGTPAYLAPEVVCQEEQDGYQAVVDSWSVGVVVFSMLTNCSPFMDPYNVTDVKEQIKLRIIEWSTLRQRHVSKDCEDFIRHLLQRRPEVRMSLSHARSHQWIRRHKHLDKQLEERSQPRRTASPQEVPDRDLSMREVGEPDENAMDEDGDNGQPEASSSQAPSGSQRPGGRLLRHRQLIEEAVEKDGPPRLPSEDMAEAAAQVDAQDKVGPLQSRPNKRKAIKGALEEKEGGGDANDDMSVLAPLPVNTRAKRARSDVEMSSVKPGKGRGRGGKVVVTRGKQAANQSSDASEEEETKPRRSSRLTQSPQKALGGR